MRRAGIAMLLLAAALVCSITNARASERAVADASVITESTSGSVAEQPVAVAQGVNVPLWFELLLFAGLGTAATVLLRKLSCPYCRMVSRPPHGVLLCS